MATMNRFYEGLLVVTEVDEVNQFVALHTRRIEIELDDDEPFVDISLARMQGEPHHYRSVHPEAIAYVAHLLDELAHA